jgi:chromosome segregation ATPase
MTASRHELRHNVLAASCLVAVAAGVLLVWNPWPDLMPWVAGPVLLAALAGALGVALTDRPRSTETSITPEARAEERMATVRSAMLSQKLAALQAEHDHARAEVERSRTERETLIAARDEALAREEAARTGVQELKRRGDELLERVRKAESQPSASRSDVDPAELESRRRELDGLRTERDTAMQAERLAKKQAQEWRDEAASLRAKVTELVALCQTAAQMEGVGKENDELRARNAGLIAEIRAYTSRAETAEAAVARLETSQIEVQARHASQLGELRARINELDGKPSQATDKPAPTADASAEVQALRARIAETEEALRTALRELGVDPSHWPLTTEGVTQAIGPLTLFALGETTPGWKPTTHEDTLVSAVIELGRRAIERQRQVERLGAVLAQSAGRR